MNVYLPSSGFATQGPCDDGFHVPLKSEWDNLISYGTTLGAFSGGNFCTYLHIPKNGERYMFNASVTNTTYGYYWSSSKNDNGERYFFVFNDGQALETGSDWGTYGMNIRPFKNTPVIPDSNWTVEFQGTGTAGIYHDSTSGLISISSDGINRITISDKNCGATEVYNNGTSITQSNGGYFYQRGNNYGFALSGSLTTSATRVDATGYGPGNYYSSSTFILTSSSPYNWDTSNNGNLRGGEDGNVNVTTMKELKNAYIGEYVHNFATQGPCPSGFHVPLNTEWQVISDAGVSLGAWSSSNGANFATYLKIPMVGYRNYSNLSFSGRGSRGYYWSSSPNDANYAYNLYFNASNVYQTYNSRPFGYPIRCFKDSPVVPTASWTKLYGTSIESGGIFWSSTDGLISISSNGSTWYTISDKNLGATTVYNYGDTLTEANGGKIYQRGNNYAFSGDANYDVSQISKSSTQVNVTGYGPGNYYNSSTWITTNPRQSSASDGNNLRGGVDGNVPVE